MRCNSLRPFHTISSAPYFLFVCCESFFYLVIKVCVPYELLFTFFIYRLLYLSVCLLIRKERFVDFFHPFTICSIRGDTKFLCVCLLEKRIFIRGLRVVSQRSKPLIFLPTQLGKFYFPQRAITSALCHQPGPKASASRPLGC